MRRRRQEAQSGDEDNWLITYADAITLLMAFFIMLVSFSRIEVPLFEEMAAGIKEQIGGRVATERPIYSLNARIQAIVDTTQDLPPGEVQVGFDDEGVVIDFLTGSFFEPGSTELSDVAQTVLRTVKRELEEPPYDLYFVDVEGHTDDVPVDSGRFPSNWELSAFQAATVVRYLIEQGMPRERLKAAGFADSRPKVPNRDIMGEPVPENRMKNRRITVRLHP